MCVFSFFLTTTLKPHNLTNNLTILRKLSRFYNKNLGI